MSNLPERLYHPEHTWIIIEISDMALIGITDFAQDTLGDIIDVGFPSVGSYICKGLTCGTIESRKAITDIITPVSGVVIDINESLSIDPVILNNDCYGKGWIVRVKLANPLELSQLMLEEEYQEHIG